MASETVPGFNGKLVEIDGLAAALRNEFERWLVDMGAIATTSPIENIETIISTNLKEKWRRMAYAAVEYLEEN